MNEQRAARAGSPAVFTGASRPPGSRRGGFGRRLRLAGLVLGLLLTGARAQTALAPSDFAYGMPVEAVTNAPLQMVVLPPEVYLGTTEPGLRDLRVFNAAGQVVPHAVVSAPDFEPLEPRLERVPVYSLMAEEEREDLGNLPEGQAQPETAEGLDLESVLGLREARRGPPAYLIDASEVEEEIRGLRLYWDETSSFMSTIVVESSDDLLLWEPWSDPVAVAGLQAGEAALTRNALTLPARRASFIRLAHAEGAQLPLPPLTRAEVELVTEVDEEARQWWRPEVSGSEAGAATFDLGAWPSIDSMRLMMPAGTVLAELTLASAANPNRGWGTRAEGLFYRLGGEEAQVRDTAGFPPTNDRYWRLELAGLMPEEVVLELGQIPERLVFVARGEGPFTLAYGSAVAGDIDPQLSSLLDLGALQDGEVEVASASLGAPFELGGESVLVGPGAVRLQFAVFMAALLAVMMVTLIALRRRLERRRAEPEAQ